MSRSADQRACAKPTTAGTVPSVRSLLARRRRIRHTSLTEVAAPSRYFIKCRTLPEEVVVQRELRWWRQPTVVGRRVRGVRDQQDPFVVSEELRDTRGRLGVRAVSAGALLTRWDVGHNFIDVHPAPGPGVFSTCITPHGTAQSDFLVSRAEIPSIPHRVYIQVCTCEAHLSTTMANPVAADASVKPPASVSMVKPSSAMRVTAPADRFPVAQ